MNKKSLYIDDKSNKKRSKPNNSQDLSPGCIATIELLLRRTLQLSVRYSAFIVAPCLISIFFISCENDVKQIDDLTKKVTTQEEGINIESYLSQQGKLKAKLKAPLMIRVTSDTVYAEFPQTLHVDFYNDSTQIETRLDSKYGKYFETQNKVYLRDSVVVINVKGDTLKSPDLWWDKNTQLFYTDKYAIYHGIGKNIYGGQGLVATQDLNSITFKQPTGTVQVSDNGLSK